MPDVDVFISHAVDHDSGHAKALSEALRRYGLRVWVSTCIPAGAVFDEEISSALETARCVVVIWSPQSVRSRWVREEATHGLERGILVPVLVDGVKPPIGFQLVQGILLSAGLDAICTRVLEVVGKPPRSIGQHDHDVLSQLWTRFLKERQRSGLHSDRRLTERLEPVRSQILGRYVVLVVLVALGLASILGVPRLVELWRRPTLPLTLVPDMVKATSTYPTNDEISAAAITSRAPYSIELRPETFSDGFAGACWELAAPVNVTSAVDLVFWVQTDIAGDFEFKAERADGQDNHKPITRHVEAGPWSAVRVHVPEFDARVHSALGKLCVGADTKTHAGTSRFKVKNVEAR